jgi:hypothetical protein
MLLDLIKSFIVQLLLLLPGESVEVPSLSRERFEELLDHTPSVEKALGVFRDLRAFAPSYIHCVIDATRSLRTAEMKLTPMTSFVYFASWSITPGFSANSTHQQQTERRRLLKRASLVMATSTLLLNRGN